MILPFKDEPKVSVLLKTYKYYKLYGRIKKADLEEYNKTKDESLIVYRYCTNELNKTIKDYRTLLAEKKRKEKEDYKNFRLSQGFKCV